MRNSFVQNLKNLQRRLFASIWMVIKFMPKYVWYGLLAVILVAFLAYILFQSNLFLLSKLEIPDLVYVDKILIQEKTKKYIGERIFSISTDEIESLVSAQSPYIKSVEAEKVLPHRINLHIKDRKPI
jgi:cell division septal protein FtsQ